MSTILRCPRDPTGTGRFVGAPQQRIQEGGPPHHYPRENTRLPWDGHRLYSPGQG